MDNYVAPEVLDYARQIVKQTIGTKAVLKSVEWAGGGLYNKVYYVNTNQGDFILKMECDQIFLSTRKDQIENEVSSSKLLKDAGVPCAAVLSYDFTENEIGKRYVFSQRITNDILYLYWDSLTNMEKEEIRAEVLEILQKMNGITSTYFGSITDYGKIGRHQTWKDCSKAISELLIKDCENLSIMTQDEISALKIAAERSLDKCNAVYTPTFNHNDFGSHNMILGSIEGGKKGLYVIDFGNAFFGLPAYSDFMVFKMGDFGFLANCNILKQKALDESAYDNMFINDLERVLWMATLKHTNDYAHCTDWMTEMIIKSKEDASRSYITEFIEKYSK